ncbi:MAG: SirB2 family protein [Gammaproteobacteria bacterium]|nr:SirB2 family protein [Gammaproteobacteria bacterium]
MLDSYLLLKQIHVSTAVISVTLFVVRGIWMMAWPHLLTLKTVRVIPHIVDTVLLASALALTWWISQYPFVQGWLTAKILALFVYIILGSVALKRGGTKRVRIIAWLLALVTFAYIVAVAITRQVIPLG